MTAELGAFVPHGKFTVSGAAGGPLSGLTFAAKDLFDVAGHATGAGNPAWLETHPPAKAHAWAVAALLDAGATLTGKTLTDELAYGLTGRNAHYGTPRNSAAPDRLPGGSSSGSAAAVAGKAVDFALGSDTGGSVRIPASYCGLFGIRTSHGRIPLDGVVALSPSFDTAGWFTRDAALLERVGEVLLRERAVAAEPGRLLVAEDGFALAEPAVSRALQPMLDRAACAIGSRESIRVYPADIDEWRESFRLLQGYEVWQSDGAWITRVRPKFGPDVQERFDLAKTVTEADIARPRQIREAMAAQLDRLLGQDGVLCLPTSPVPAPRRDAGFDSLGDVRKRTMALTCIAGLARLPQVSLPAGTVDGAPVGLSLIAARGGDMRLLALARAIAG
jgi:amidase